MLSEEADDWWVTTRTELDSDGIGITWAIFKREFMRKYYPEDVRGKKEIEFLELKQGSMIVLEYVSKFVELAKHYVHYTNDAAGEFSKCIKFENGLRDEIKQGIRYQRIRRFADLVDCSRIFEEDSIKLKSSHSRELVDKKGKKPMDRGTPYGRGNPRVGNWRRPSGGDSGAPFRCFNCGETGHKRDECKKEEKKCFKCGRVGHVAPDCKMRTVTCYNCGEEGHISTQCTKPKKNQSGGKVFALSGSETTPEDRLIKGTCFIHNTPLIAIIDTGATHSFISLDCAKRLNLEITKINGSMVIDTPASGSVTTSSTCLNCPIDIFGRIHINCFTKTVIFAVLFGSILK